MRKMSKTKIIGVTGNIASGKTVFSDYLEEKGYCIIDTDIITNDLYDNDESFNKKIIDTFNNQIISLDNKVNKKLLSDMVFNDPNLLKKLNDITHPIIIDNMLKKIETYKNNDILFVIVPLLFELKLEKYFDIIVCISSTKTNQLKRLMKRNMLNKEDAYKRINTQLAIEKKIKLADYNIDNNDDIKSFIKNIECFLVKVKELIK